MHPSTKEFIKYWNLYFIHICKAALLGHTIRDMKKLFPKFFRCNTSLIELISLVIWKKLIFYGSFKIYKRQNTLFLRKSNVVHDKTSSTDVQIVYLDYAIANHLHKIGVHKIESTAGDIRLSFVEPSLHRESLVLKWLVCFKVIKVLLVHEVVVLKIATMQQIVWSIV